MGCDMCDKAHDSGRYFAWRGGNDKIGWGTILIVACRAHATLVLDKLNDEPEPGRIYHEVNLHPEGGEMK
jgi:hypothetical protein